ncbi:MAG: four helix bundle protein [Bacteroidales bacterium]|nr:four helix bundle protein [Bacteroidales bacterium]
MMYKENEMRDMNEQTDKQERNNTFFRFEDLRIYHKALDYITWLQDVTSLFPENDKSQLALRFNESARNIALYIAEGSARNKTQFVYYLRMAKSSIRQCMVYTTLSYGLNHMTETYENESRTQLMEMTKMIGALISSLQRSVNNNTGYHNNGHHHNGNGHHKNEEEYSFGSFEENYLPEE